jgi:hypothetical protein
MQTGHRTKAETITAASRIPITRLQWQRRDNEPGDHHKKHYRNRAPNDLFRLDIITEAEEK